MNTRPALLRTSSLAPLLGCAALALAQAAPEVPDSIKPPQGETLLLRAHASGSQIYVCSQPADGKAQWTLKAPDAELRDEQGKAIIHHSAGPSWQHTDGSAVTGRAVARADSPEADAIPWLLVTAVSHQGHGVLAQVTSIQRLHTHGGQPPLAAHCDAARLNAEIRVPYTADYYFYAPAPRPAH